ncbi:small acid-soluble spore protein P [Paenibacillus alvei]|jgi:small acid-soluble spore protein P (minor)|uniref:Spore protein n=1 Tax=Paenibacillus alvei TaxID=44250 RepID=A0A383RK54_PAEAL|nr:small acid-soluble spore protein P [Paenibacillus alvei]SYX87071.1 Spore protein [Paenibacillus alvei]
MSKPRAVPVPNKEQSSRHQAGNERNAMQEPLSGSKKTKMANHVSHNNPEG